jgi:hypothetical protein
MAPETILSCLITGQAALIWIATKSRNCVIAIEASAPTVFSRKANKPCGFSDALLQC